jgi:hypothetical protein
MDEAIAAIPDDTGAAIAATSSCVTVGTLMELDGETEVRLSGRPEFTPTDDLALAWSGTIATAGTLEVQTSAGRTLLTMPWQSPEHPVVHLWTNDDREPDLIRLVVDPPS